MHIVLNIRGSMGSGKSTAVRSLMAHYDIAKEIRHAVRDRVIGYRLNSGLVVLGRYETACGGCDALSNFSEIVQLIHEYSQTSSVIFESLLWSGVFKSSNNLAEELKDQAKCIFATLDTPVSRCIQRVGERRAIAGTIKAFDPSNLIAKHQSVIRTHAKLDLAGHDTRVLSHTATLPIILEWLKEGH